jgi:cystathionine beta-lyase/cystathionine gamma-synthase
LQRPLGLGADVVLHSTTKYLGGHSDVVGGAVVAKERDLHEELYFYQNATGPVAGPFDAWLVLRGIKTLAVRMRAHEENAFAVAEFLCGHPYVESVVYPGLREHPGHELAKRQMSGFGGMVTFHLRGGRPQADAFARALKLFAFAESLGGVESLACHPATMTHATMSREEQEQRGITEGTIRLSVGIEDVDDLLADLNGALTAAARV